MGRDPASTTGTTLLVLLRDPTNPQNWVTFVERYTPTVMGWCRQWNLQPADAEDVTQEVLHKLAQKVRTFPYDPSKGRFRAWLKTLAHHAWSDLYADRKRAGQASGDPQMQHLLDNQADSRSLAEALENEFMLELYEEAKARVQLRVNRTTWQIFQLLAVDGWSGADVAAKFHMQVAAVYVAKNRVYKMLAAEIRKLEGSGRNSEGASHERLSLAPATAGIPRGPAQSPGPGQPHGACGSVRPLPNHAGGPERGSPRN
jgi:RNA polymerase sigma factor (sigma-70 family)